MNALKKIGIGLGYVVFFVLCTAVFVRVLFPTDQAKEFAAQRLAEMTGAESVTIGDLGLSGFIPSGVEIEKLEMRLPGVKVKTPERGGTALTEPRVVKVDALEVETASLSGLLGGAPDVTFEARIGAGSIRGARYVREKDGPHVIKIEAIDKVPLGPERLFLSLVGFDIRGDLSGKIDLTIPVGERDGRMQTFFDQMGGRVEIQLRGAEVKSPIVDSAQGRMALTDIDLGEVRLALQAEGGMAAANQPQTGDPKTRAPKGREATVIAIEEASVDGPDLGVAVAPRSAVSFVQGGGPKEASLNVHLALVIHDALIDKEAEDPKNPDKMTKPNVALRYLMQANPIKGHTVDGQFGVAITGTIGDAKVRTERPRTRVGGTGGTTRKLNIDHPEGEGEDGGEDKPGDNGGATRPPPPETTSKRPTTIARPRPTQPSLPSTPGSPGGRPRPVIPTDPVPGDEPTAEPEPIPVAPPTPEPPPAVDPPMEPEAPVPEGEGGEVPMEEPIAP
ncbi:MAG: type II secretion system protein GspN [Deltaproteobacteria bacterium]|nr:type II secretion system protein GspN [Deltaproteobacteria bacterium]